MLEVILKALIWTFILVVGAFLYACCKVSSDASRREEMMDAESEIAAEVEIEEEFNGYLYCDDDCLYCDSLKKCQRSAMKK